MGPAGRAGKIRIAMPARYRIRRATRKDIPALVRHRIEMFHSMMEVPDRDAALIAAGFRRHLGKALPSGQYLGWVAECRSEIVAGAGVIPRLLLPRPRAPRGGIEAYVLNVYTEPAHRRRGLAKRLMRAVLAWARREKAVQVSLHASDAGRPVYEGLGFEAGREIGFASLRGAGTRVE